MSDRVFVYMAGADDKEPLFESQGYAGKTTAAFKTFCLDKIDESIGSFLLTNFHSVHEFLTRKVLFKYNGHRHRFNSLF